MQWSIFCTSLKKQIAGSEYTNAPHQETTEMKCKIDSLVQESVVTVDHSETVQQGVSLMAEKNAGSLVVTAAGEVIGLFTERDLVSRVVGAGKEASTLTLGDVCTRDLVSISSDSSCQDAIRKMNSNACRRLVVYRGSRFLGLINLQDVANALAEKSKGNNLLINCVSGVTLAAAIAMIALLLYNFPKMLQLADALGR